MEEWGVRGGNGGRGEWGRDGSRSEAGLPPVLRLGR